MFLPTKQLFCESLPFLSDEDAFLISEFEQKQINDLNPELFSSPPLPNPTDQSHQQYSRSILSQVPSEPPLEKKSHPCKFRLSAKKFFLTFPGFPPNFSLTVSDVEQVIVNKLEDKLLSLLVSKELHKDGSVHFHILFAYKKKISITSPDHWNWIFGKPGHYQTVRNIKHAYSYVTKDLNFSEWGEPLVKRTSQQTRMRIIRSIFDRHTRPALLLENASDDLHLTIYQDASKPDLYFQRVQTYRHYQKLLQRPKFVRFDLEAVLAFLKTHRSSPHYHYLKRTLPILQLINRCFTRFYKAPNILLWSHKPNLGKSALCNLLSKHFASYSWPQDHWYEHYDSHVFDFIFWDEFSLRGQNEEFLKLLFAGASLQLPVKGSHNLKEDNPLIIATANDPLRTMVKAKRPFFCECSSFKDLNTLCNLTPLCTPPQRTFDLFDALATRNLQYELTEPIFPPGRERPDLFHDYERLLLSFLVQDHSPRVSPS